MCRFLAARLVFLGLLVVTTTACDSCRRRGAPTQTDKTRVDAAASASAVVAPVLPPLQAPDKAMTLAVRGHADVELLVPLGATTARPLVAVLFPAMRELRQPCESFGQLVRGEAFVLCQMPHASAARATPAGVETDLSASALRAALHTVKRKFGHYVDSKDLALAGVGEGAEAVAPIVRQVPDFFHRVALFDAGFRQWSSVDSVRFVGAGGRALLARCTEELCRSEAMRVVATVRAAGIATRLEPEDGAAPEADPAHALAWLIHAEPRSFGPARGPEAPATEGSNRPEIH